jgi:hypothetical protein
MSNCTICNQKTQIQFTALVLNKYEAKYFYCQACGFLQIVDPFWLDEAYSNAIASTDTGLVMRNNYIAKTLAVFLFFTMNERGRGKYLDAAGGYGMLTRLMRDYGFDFYWSDKYCNNLLARGFDSDSIISSYKAVTAFEVFEHITNPCEFVIEKLTAADSNTLIFSTELFEGSPPAPNTWWYYTLETGQHVSFFQKRTLQNMAKRLNMNCYSHGSFHILTNENFSATLLKVLFSRFGHLLIPFVKKNLQSKTWSDNLYLKDVISSYSKIK